MVRSYVHSATCECSACRAPAAPAPRPSRSARMGLAGIVFTFAAIGAVDVIGRLL